ncbi:MAG: hypothetical protein QNJ68_16640 [Microcoleaceae cyanobacterium MO_207.B10]|nr:hypothetical protein [Microcoleaceae cyanobacterium MO_207.B10]
MKAATTKTVLTATIAMVFTVSLTASPTKAQEKSTTNGGLSSQELLSNNAKSLSNDRNMSLTQESPNRGRNGYSQGELDTVTNNINLQMQKGRTPKWKSEQKWFDEKWDSLVEF